MKKLLLISIVLTLITSSCDYFKKRKITGHYYLVAVDINYNTALCYDDEPDSKGSSIVVSACVFGCFIC